MSKEYSGQIPREYIGSRGLAYVEVLSFYDEIKGLIEKGYSISAIFRMYFDKQMISEYTFNTFRRAILKAELKAKRANVATKTEKSKPGLNSNQARRPKPHDMQRPHRQVFESLTGIDHIGLGK